LLLLFGVFEVTAEPNNCFGCEVGCRPPPKPNGFKSDDLVAASGLPIKKKIRKVSNHMLHDGKSCF
jgi:hypothetical protein